MGIYKLEKVEYFCYFMVLFCFIVLFFSIKSGGLFTIIPWYKTDCADFYNVYPFFFTAAFILFALVWALLACIAHVIRTKVL